MYSDLQRWTSLNPEYHHLTATRKFRKWHCSDEAVKYKMVPFSFSYSCSDAGCAAKLLLDLCMWVCDVYIHELMRRALRDRWHEFQVVAGCSHFRKWFPGLKWWCRFWEGEIEELFKAGSEVMNVQMRICSALWLVRQAPRPSSSDAGEGKITAF